jgi:hypothetical protein
VESRCRDDLSAARWAVQEAETEARKAPQDFRVAMLAQVRQRRTRLAKLHAELRKVTEELQRRELHGEEDEQSKSSGHVGPEEPLMSDEERRRRQVRAGIATLERTSQSIQRSVCRHCLQRDRVVSMSNMS